MKYCQKCGKPNDPDSIFCNKCGNSFTVIARVERHINTPVIAVKSKVELHIPSEQEDEYEEEVARIRKNRRRVAPPQAPMNDQDIRVGSVSDVEGDEETELDDDDQRAIAIGQDSPSLQYVPQVERLEIESIQSDIVQGIKFGTLVQLAEMEKAQNAAGAR